MESIFYDPLTIDLSFQSRLFDIKILDKKISTNYVTNLLKFFQKLKSVLWQIYRNYVNRI